jgi:phage terminase large subunit
MQPSATYRPHAKQKAAHLAFLMQGYKRGVLLMGRQSGKTFFATQHAWLSGVIEQGRYFIVFKTYKQAHEVVWRQYIPLIPKELVFKTNEQDLLIELNYVHGEITMPDGTKVQVQHDESKPRSTIQLLGSDQSDSHRGFKGHGIIFDEYADQDPNNWDAVYKHFFTTTDGWAIFMGTPRGYNHFYDLIQFAREEDRWFYLEATWRDSPYVKPEFISEERREAEKKGTLSTFLQEVELEFRSVQEAVYPMFNRKIHVVDPDKVPTEGTLIGVIDYGWSEGHPTAFNLILIDSSKDWWIFDEIHVTYTQIEDIIEMIRQKIPPEMRLTALVGDSARPDLIEMMQSKNMPVVPVVKKQNSIPDGIQLVGEALLPRERIMGPPKPKMFFTSNCKNTIRQMENYKYAEPKNNRPSSAVPIKDDDDHPDAIRYGKLHFKYGIMPTSKPISSGLQFNEYGL